MTSITSLPAELLLNIFDQFDKLTDLIECRLVCRAWKDPVERAMLGHTITISGNTAMMDSLYAFLQIDLAKTYLIKHLHFKNTMHPYSLIDILHILQLIITTNIESITGYVWNDINTIERLMGVDKEGSTNNLGKLKIMTLSYGDEKPPLELALHSRKSIQKMALDFFHYENGRQTNWAFMDRLNEFCSLTTLSLAAAIENYEDLNRIVDNCPHLRVFTLEIIDWVYLNFDVDQQVIKRHPNLKTLKICDGDCSSYMIEYFLFKLINLEEISIGAVVWPEDEEVIRMLKAIQRVPQKEAIYTVKSKHALPDVVSLLKEAGYTITIENQDASFDIHVKVVF